MPFSGIKIVASGDTAALYEPQVRRQLLQWGLSAAGVQQLASGQMPTDPRDRKLIAAIVAKAAGD